MVLLTSIRITCVRSHERADIFGFAVRHSRLRVQRFPRVPATEVDQPGLQSENSYFMAEVKNTWKTTFMLHLHHFGTWVASSFIFKGRKKIYGPVFHVSLQVFI